MPGQCYKILTTFTLRKQEITKSLTDNAKYAISNVLLFILIKLSQWDMEVFSEEAIDNPSISWYILHSIILCLAIKPRIEGRANSEKSFIQAERQL